MQHVPLKYLKCQLSLSMGTIQELSYIWRMHNILHNDPTTMFSFIQWHIYNKTTINLVFLLFVSISHINVLYY